VTRNQEYNEKALICLYASSKPPKIILNEIAALPKQSETLVKTLDERLKGNKEINPRGIVTFFKTLQEFGMGKFIPGRRGHSSRFRWEVDSRHIDSAARRDLDREQMGSHPIPVHQDEAQHGSHKIGMRSHKYYLRPDLQISVHLPTDMTTAEAGRLSQSISSLPYV